MYIHLLRRLIDWTDDEEGQGMVEYALIIVLIAVVTIAIMSIVGHQISNSFSDVTNTMNTH